MSYGRPAAEIAKELSEREIFYSKLLELSGFYWLPELGTHCLKELTVLMGHKARVLARQMNMHLGSYPESQLHPEQSELVDLSTRIAPRLISLPLPVAFNIQENQRDIYCQDGQGKILRISRVLAFSRSLVFNTLARCHAATRESPAPLPPNIPTDFFTKFIELIESGKHCRLYYFDNDAAQIADESEQLAPWVNGHNVFDILKIALLDSLLALSELCFKLISANLHLFNPEFIAINSSLIAHLYLYESNAALLTPEILKYKLTSIDRITIDPGTPLNQVMRILSAEGLFPNTHYLQLNNCTWVDDGVINYILKNFPNLWSLELNGCSNVSSTSLQQIAVTYGPSLKRLSLANCSVDDSALLAIAQNCFDLNHLDLTGCRSFTDAALTNTATKCARLTTLILDGCKQISDIPVIAIATHCKQLKYFMANDCQLLTDRSFSALSKCHHLQVIKARRCPKVSNFEITQIMQNCRNLFELEVEGCEGTSRLDLSSLSRHVRISSLSMANCSGVDDHAILKTIPYLGELVSIDLSNSKVTDSVVMALAKYCKKINRAVFEGVSLLTDAGITPLFVTHKEMRVLRLSDCPKLTRESLQHLMYMKNLEVLTLDLTKIDDDTLQLIIKNNPNLRILSVNWCMVSSETLEAIANHCPRLNELRIGGIKNDKITNAKVIDLLNKCPLLNKLELEACVLLTDAVLFEMARLGRHYHTINFNFTKITAVGLQAILTTHLAGSLTSLCLNYSDVGDGFLTQVLPNLTHLELKGLAITDVTPPNISHCCPSLTHLQLSECAQLSAHGLRDLGSIPIEALNFYVMNPKVLDEFHKMLAQTPLLLPKLTKLDVPAGTNATYIRMIHRTRPEIRVHLL